MRSNQSVRWRIGGRKSVVREEVRGSPRRIRPLADRKSEVGARESEVAEHPRSRTPGRYDHSKTLTGRNRLECFKHSSFDGGIETDIAPWFVPGGQGRSVAVVVYESRAGALYTRAGAIEFPGLENRPG